MGLLSGAAKQLRGEAKVEELAPAMAQPVKPRRSSRKPAAAVGSDEFRFVDESAAIVNLRRKWNPDHLRMMEDVYRRSRLPVPDMLYFSPHEYELIQGSKGVSFKLVAIVKPGSALDYFFGADLDKCCLCGERLAYCKSVAIGESIELSMDSPICAICRPIDRLLDLSVNPFFLRSAEYV